MGQSLTLALPPAVEVVELPARGEATLTWYADRAMNPNPSLVSFPRRSSDQTILTITSAPWHQTGVRPFAWDYFEFAIPQIRLAVQRGVTVTQTSVTFNGALIGRYEEVPIGSTWLYPWVHVYRCQDDGLLSDPELTLDWHSVIGQPELILTTPEYDPAADYFAIDMGDVKSELLKAETVQVTPNLSGVSFEHIQGSSKGYFKGYAALDVTLSNPGQPAAFCYDARLEDRRQQPQTLPLPVTTPAGTRNLSFSVQPVEIVIRIVRTRGVKMHLRAHEDDKDALIVETYEVSSITEVPPQGVALEKHDFQFRRHEIDELIRNNEPPFVLELFVLAIGFIPVVGTLYDLGELAWAAYTGKDFLGYEVGENELALMGVTTAIGLGTSKRVQRLLRRAVKGTKLATAAEEVTLAEIRRIADPDFVHAVDRLQEQQLEKLATNLQKHLRDPVAFPLPKLVGELNDDLAKGYLPSTERQLLQKTFNEDFSGFRNADLAAAYNRYKLAKKGAALDPVDWAKKQSAVPRGRPCLLLRRELGDDFVKLLNRERPKSKVIPKPLTQKDIDNYDHLVGHKDLGVRDFGTLDNLSKPQKMPGFRQNFQIDHLLEQRFWRNNPNLESAFDEKGVGMAFVVPKNAAVARDMLRFPGSTKKIIYVHTLKTRLLNQLIPRGAEPFATVQDIWDAHAYVLRQLELATGPIKKRFAKDVELMARELKQSFNSRIPTTTDMQRFPRFVQDASGAWSRVVAL